MISKSATRESFVSSGFVLFCPSTVRIQDLLNSWEFNTFQNGFRDLRHYARVSTQTRMIASFVSRGLNSQEDI